MAHRAQPTDASARPTPIRAQLCSDHPATAPTTPIDNSSGRPQQRPNAPATAAIGPIVAIRSRIGQHRPQLFERRCALVPVRCEVPATGEPDLGAGLGEDVHTVDKDAG